MPPDSMLCLSLFGPSTLGGTFVFDCVAGGHGSSLNLDLVHLAENFSGHLQTKHNMVSKGGPLQNQTKSKSIQNQPKKAKVRVFL